MVDIHQVCILFFNQDNILLCQQLHPGSSTYRLELYKAAHKVPENE